MTAMGDWRRSQVVDLTRQGMTAPQIAVVLGITARSVQRHRQQADCLVTQRRRPVTADEIAVAGKLLDEGCSYEEAARTLGRGARTIRRYFPGRGWDRATIDAHLAAVRRYRIQMNRHEGVFIK